MENEEKVEKDEKELLKRSVELAEDNNKILRLMWRSMRISRFMSLVYWVFIIGIAVGSYYFIQPYFSEIYAEVTNNFSTFNEMIKNFQK